MGQDRAGVVYKDLPGVAIEAGTIELLSAWAGSSLHVWIVPIAFSLIGAVISFFFSTLGVVCPALYPRYRGRRPRHLT